MLVYSAELPLDPKTNTEALLELAGTWLTGSQHRPFCKDDLPVATDGTISHAQKAGETASCGLIDASGVSYIGFRHVWTEDREREWVTEIVGSQDSTNFDVGIRLYCSALSPGTELPTPRKPYIVRQLFEVLGGGPDGSLMVTDKPQYASEALLEPLAAVINGNGRCKLPLVYVSCDHLGHPLVDVEYLARRVSGHAHVVVEPSRSYSRDLRSKVNNANPYLGAISVFWPRGVGRRIRIFPWMEGGSQNSIRRLEKELRAGLLRKRPTRALTWSNLRELVSQRRVANLQAAESPDVEEWVEAFSAENDAMRSRLEEAELEIARLEADLGSASAHAARAGGNLLQAGAEQDFYEDESLTIVLDALNRATSTMLEDSRQRHIVDSLIEANATSDNREVRRNKIKEILHGCSKFGGKEQKALEAMGFSISGEGKHIKAVYMGDDRYVFSIAKTSSDHRAGKNLASEINKKIH